MQDSSSRLLNLLAVENDPAHAVLLQNAFGEIVPKCRITVVEDGETALSHLLSHAAKAAHRPDLILLNFNLPRMTGHEVLRFIKGDVIMRTIPVVVLTTSTAPEDVSSAYHSRANSYLRKPNDLKETFETVRALQRFWLDLVVLPSVR